MKRPPLCRSPQPVTLEVFIGARMYDNIVRFMLTNEPLFHRSVTDYCLASNEQFVSHNKARTSYIWWDYNFRCLLDHRAALDFDSVISPKQPSTGIYVAPCGHNILIPNQPVFALTPECCVFGAKTANTNFVGLFIFSYLFFWPLCCLFFFDIRILITPLVSSNSSYSPRFDSTWARTHLQPHSRRTR